MKIGILTLFHGNRNWGGMLQGYALKTFLETSFPGTQADLLRYKLGRNVIYTNKLQQIQQYSAHEVFKKISTKTLTKMNRKYRQRLMVRNQRFREFEKRLTTNAVVYTDEMLRDAAREYDCLICGSDQVWNPNVGKAGFFLAPVSNECKKISYAASIARDELSEHERSVMLPLIERFDSISVREKTAKNILEQNLKDREIAEVLDPVFMLTKEQWDKVADQSAMQFNGQYAVGFFFGESAKKRERIERFCAERGLVLKCIPYAKGEYMAKEEKGNAEQIFDIGPCEFVSLLKNAQCVFTDSFHGAAFSVVFEKQFCVFERSKKSKVSQNSRLYDLLEKFGLSDRMIKDADMIDVTMKRPVDYTRIRDVLQMHRETSMAFLKDAISVDKVKDNSKRVHVGELEKWECTGCGLCAAKCPTKSIKMVQDEEGFMYPAVDMNACTKCGACMNLCRKKKTEKAPGDRTLVGFHENAGVRAKSSSGGLFFALAQTILKENGVVYGAAFSDDFSVKHRRATSLDELESLLTSKYVQSDMSGIYSQIREDVRSGLQVLFAGTPCQCAAIRSYIGESTHNLILVDFICHGVPSPGVWRAYLRYLTDKKNGRTIKSVSFRDKEKSWHDFCMKITFDKGLLHESHDKNVYMNSFLSNKNLRKSCYRCEFKGKYSRADITLGDAWKIEKEFSDWADDKGTSVAVIRTDRGEALFKKAKEDFVFRESSYSKWCRFNPSLEESTECPNGRRAFFETYKNLSNNDFWGENKKISIKKRVRYMAKKVTKVLGIDNALRKRI